MGGARVALHTERLIKNVAAELALLVCTGQSKLCHYTDYLIFRIKERSSRVPSTSAETISGLTPK